MSSRHTARAGSPNTSVHAPSRFARACRSPASARCCTRSCVPRRPPNMFEPSPKSRALRERLIAFFDRHVLPNEALFHEQIHQQRWQVPAIVEELKVKARAEGLWNLFLPESERG